MLGQAGKRRWSSSNFRGSGEIVIIRLWSTSVFSNFSKHQNHLEGLVTHRLLGPNPGVSGSIGLEWGLRTLISSKFPGDVHDGGPGTALKSRRCIEIRSITYSLNKYLLNTYSMSSVVTGSGA